MNTHDCCKIYKFWSELQDAFLQNVQTTSRDSFRFYSDTVMQKRQNRFCTMS